MRAGNLDPAAYSAMCRGVKAMVDLYRLADEEMELIRNEETEATAIEVVGDHGDPAILNAAAQIAAQQNQYRIESLIDQGLATLEQTQDADEPAQPVLTDKGRRRFGYQRLTKYTQEDLDNLKYLIMERSLRDRQIPELRDALAKMRAAMEEALADLARNPAPPPRFPDRPAPQPAAGRRENRSAATRQPRQRRTGRKNPRGSAPADEDAYP